MPMERSTYSLPPELGSVPWYMIQHGKHEQNQIFFNPIDGSLHHRSILEMRKKTCLGCSHGYLMMLDKSSKKCVLLGLDHTDVIPLPQLQRPQRFANIRSHFWLSSFPSTIGCTVIFVSAEEIIYYRLHGGNDKEWQSMDNLDESDGFGFCHGIASFKGKLYVHSGVEEDLMIIDVSSPDIEAEDFYVKERIETQYDIIHCKKVLVGYDEELFEVNLNFENDDFLCDGLFINAEVYKLNFSKSIWERVESIGSDRAIFIGDEGLTYMTKDERVKGDCIYFLQPWYDGLRQYKFRLDERLFSYKVIWPQFRFGWRRTDLETTVLDKKLFLVSMS